MENKKERTRGRTQRRCLLQLPPFSHLPFLTIVRVRGSPDFPYSLCLYINLLPKASEIVLSNPTLCAHCTVRPHKPKRGSLDQKYVYWWRGASLEDGRLRFVSDPSYWLARGARFFKGKKSKWEDVFVISAAQKDLSCRLPGTLLWLKVLLVTVIDWNVPAKQTSKSWSCDPLSFF